MSREVPYGTELKCDNCGKIGAFDFMGDYICGECIVTDEEGTVVGVKEDKDVDE